MLKSSASVANRSVAPANGRLFVVSAPSGAGKTTLCDAARQRLPQLVYSVSTTTRAPRPGEREGRDYFFVSVEQFQRGIAQGAWAEWARVHGNYYGTGAAFIDAHRTAGRDLLLDIDVQGARQILQRYPEAVTIFIMAPSLAELRRRLTARGLDAPEVIERRMQNAQNEIACRSMYRHVIVNDDVTVAVDRFVAILAGKAA